MKAANWGYIVGVTVGVPLLVIIVNFLFFRGNSEAPRYTDIYISNSDIITLTVPPPPDFESDYKVYYPKLQRHGNGTKVFRQIVFYSSEYRKYFSIISFELGTNTTSSHVLRRKITGYNITFRARVYPLQLNGENYGSRKKPIPVFPINLIAINGWIGGIEHAEKDFNVNNAENRAYVEQYLTYFVDKKEFKRLFW